MLVKSQKVIAAFGAWAVAVLTLLTLVGGMSYEYAFVLYLIGLLVIVQMSGPHNMSTGWKSRLNIFLLVGAAAFALLIFEKAMSIMKLL